MSHVRPCRRVCRRARLLNACRDVAHAKGTIQHLAWRRIDENLVGKAEDLCRVGVR
jgi:hypothetical protein